MSKILFVYPNKECAPVIPLGISTLSGILKYYKHVVDLFDTTFMLSERFDHDAREKTGVVKHVDTDIYWKHDNVNINDEFRKKILSFNPDLIAFSIVENNYWCAKKLFKIAKEVTKSPILVGGIFPTMAPEFFITDENVDIICIGEGEYAIAKLAKKLDDYEDTSNIPNLIVKKDDEVIRNTFHEYYNWEPNIFQDWDLFDKRHLFKPFMGKMWRTGFFEMSRGCPFNCGYCTNHMYQKIFKHLGKYHREKPIEYVIEEIEYMKTKYSLELIFFADENFLSMKKDRFEEFCVKYKERISLPFFISTRADSLLDDKKLETLKDTGCITIGIGVEHGNEEIRHKILNKRIPNNIYEKAFDNCHKHDIRTTAYFIIGLPFETEKDILNSAKFCKTLKPRSITISIFAPYYGTKLREICIENKLMENRYYKNISINHHSILNMPQISKERLEELYYKFNNLVYD